MMRKLNSVYGFLFLFLVTACSNKWEDHYEQYPGTVNQNIWDAIEQEEQVSEFVNIIREFQFDSLFNSDIPYTIFLPSNEAFNQFMAEDSFTSELLNYHISSHYIQSGAINGTQKIQMLGEKFGLFIKEGNKLSFDGINIIQESPLYNNGKYFILDKVAKPLPNLYEYFARNNPVLKSYIDSRDSIILDRENSKPIGFDNDGNTIYDSVSIVLNLFEETYFPVKQEFRNRTATIVFPLKEDYENSLTLMAQNLGGSYIDYRDIPEDWQQNILVPYLLDLGVFENMLEPSAFEGGSPGKIFKMKNILGDSIPVYYKPVEKALCSNGYAYNYDQFIIPDSLYTGSSNYEAEWLLDEVGIGRYLWNEYASVFSDQSFSPKQEYISTASNDTVIWVQFPNNYEGKFSLSFNTPSLFPRKYLMVVSTHMDIGGIYEIYVNDELIRTFDYYDFLRFRGIMPSVTGSRYLPQGRFNKFDMWVENIDNYGPARIRIEYIGPGSAPSHGLIIDNIKFIPY
jgi:hypothetical protein